MASRRKSSWFGHGCSTIRRGNILRVGAGMAMGSWVCSHAFWNWSLIARNSQGTKRQTRLKSFLAIAASLLVTSHCQGKLCCAKGRFRGSESRSRRPRGGKRLRVLMQKNQQCRKSTFFLLELLSFSPHLSPSYFPVVPFPLCHILFIFFAFVVTMFSEAKREAVAGSVSLLFRLFLFFLSADRIFEQ